MNSQTSNGSKTSTFNDSHKDHFLLAELAKPSSSVIFSEEGRPTIVRRDKLFVVSSFRTRNEREEWKAIENALRKTPATKQWKFCGRTDRVDRLLECQDSPKLWECSGGIDQFSHHLDLDTWRSIPSVEWHSSFSFGPAANTDVNVVAELLYGFFESVGLPGRDTRERLVVIISSRGHP